MRLSVVVPVVLLAVSALACRDSTEPSAGQQGAVTPPPATAPQAAHGGAAKGIDAE